MDSNIHPAVKAQADLVEAQRRFGRMQKMIADGSIAAPSDITKTPAYLVLKDAERAVAFHDQCEAMDDTAGLSALRAEGLQLQGASA